MPDFSVILPCHNAGPWVAQALKSAAAQSCAPHEIIVINDRSSDDSAEQVRRSGVETTLLEVSVGNAAAARNEGARIARGDWLAFLDADDYWLPHHLQSAAALLSGGGDVAYTSVHDDLLSDQTIRPSQRPWPWLDRPRGGLTSEEFIRCWGRVMYFSMPSTVVLRERFNEVGGLDVDQRRRHDSHLWWRVIHGHTWAFDPRADCVCRIETTGSVSRASSAASAYDAMRALLKTRPLYPQPEYGRILRNGAFVAMTEAIAYGNRDDRRRAWELSREHLPWSERALFRVGLMMPGVMGAAVRRRRRAARTRDQ